MKIKLLLGTAAIALVGFVGAVYAVVGQDMPDTPDTPQTSVTPIVEAEPVVEPESGEVSINPVIEPVEKAPEEVVLEPVEDTADRADDKCKPAGGSLQQQIDAIVCLHYSAE
jgi:hypothetical protein